MMNLLSTIQPLTVVILMALATVALIFPSLCRRVSKEQILAKPGFGGQNVIMDRGALVLPVLHETIPVNMDGLRLGVRRVHEHALMTNDHVRVDLQARFSVRVEFTKESIANTAQAVGMRTMKQESLTELVERTYVDGLRSVAAQMAQLAMEAFYEQQASFAQRVQMAVSEDLLNNGLALESVSLADREQPNRDFSHPQKAFDADRLSTRTEAIGTRRNASHERERGTHVDVSRKDLMAEQQKLEVPKGEDYTYLQQIRTIAIRKAAQTVERARRQAKTPREDQEAKIATRHRLWMRRITWPNTDARRGSD